MHCKRIWEVDSAKGVSLIELLVVVAIISILAAFAVPSFSRSLSKSNLNKQTDFLAGTISICRLKAMEQGCKWLMDFDPAKGTYIAFGDKISNNSVDPGEETIGPLKLQCGINYGSCATQGPNNSEMPEDGVSFVDNRLIFNTFGSSSAGTVYLTKNTRTSAIRVLPASGATVCWLYDGVWRKQ